MNINTKKPHLLGLSTILFILSFQISAQSIQIDNISATNGVIGATLYINGSGFDESPSNLDVQFGASKGIIVSSSKSSIEVKVPAGATYDNIVVTNKSSGLSTSSANPFLLSFGGDTFSASKLSAISNFSSESGLYDLCMCDFNNDGKIDIATANDDANFITILTNTSTFSTESFDISSITVNTKTLNIKCKDLDADGKPEILLSRTGNTTNLIYYLKNTSTSTVSFASPVALTINSNTARRIEIADLDLDGKPEIIVTNQSTNSINIFQNKSTAGVINFEITPIVIEVPNLQNSTGLIVKDFNGDKLPDICVSPFLAANLYILSNRSTIGNISFNEAQTISVSGGIANLVAGDLNNDGKVDIVATNFNNNQISILENTSDDDGGNIAFNLLSGINTIATPWGLDLGDLNGDGKLDIVITSITIPSLDAFINNSSNNISFTSENIPIDENSRNIKIGDINGDGKPDLAFTSIVNDNISTIINQNCIIPTIRNDNDISLCDGATLILNARNALNVNYKWYKDDGSGELLVKDNNESFYEESVAIGNFKFRVAAIGEGGNCIESSQIVDVTVFAGSTPVPPVFQDPGIGCENESITITLDPTGIPADASFLWTTPSGSTTETSTASLTIDNLTANDAGLYEVEVKVGSCQSDAVSIVLEIVILSNNAISNSSSLSFCNGQNTTLSVSNISGYSYQWLLDGVNINSATLNTLIADVSGDYVVEISTPESCSYKTEAVTITVYDPPISSFDSKLQTCIDSSIYFTNTSTVDNAQDISYLWDFGDGSTSTEENPTHEFATTRMFDVSLTTSYDANCIHINSVSINVIELPEITITPSEPTTICAGEELTLTSTVGFDSYLWSNGLDLAKITIDASGIYTVEAISIDNCLASASIEVVVTDLPEITIESVQNGFEFQLEAKGGIRYEWETDNTLSALDIANPIANPETTTTYTVTGYDASECSAIATITLEVTESNPIPAFFTPNGDNENDLWVIRNVQDFVDCTLIIFNRSGQIVFEKKNYANDWDGTNNGKTLQQGVYYYIINCESSNIRGLTGSVAILR